MGATWLFHHEMSLNSISKILVYLYQYIILLASLIYFWRGSQDHKDPLHEQLQKR